jgi:sensor histidine kinase YesM
VKAIPIMKRFFSSVHLLVLLGLLTFTFLPLTLIPHLPAQFLVKQLCMYLTWVGVFYLVLLVLIPNFLYLNKSTVFAIIVFAIICLVVLLNNLLDRLIDLGGIFAKISPHQGSYPNYNPTSDLSAMVITMIIVGVANIISVTRKIQADRLWEQELENQKISTELSFLKSQINPHFFFNVLHTIYGLTEMDSAKAKDSIYTLSRMMRYVLFETKNDITTLEKELMFIENYNKLMQLRLPESVQIIFDRPSAIQDVEIAPMLFLPFVENAFKHGVSSVYPSFIYIGVSQTKQCLSIEVRNSNFSKSADDMNESNDIGLINTIRRLNLLYHGKHHLKIQDLKETNEFIVQLKLFLE